MSRVTAWYVSHGSGAPAQGPFATDLVRAMLRDGQLNAMDLVYREGESEWRPASTFIELKNDSAPFEIGSSVSESAVGNDVHNDGSSGVDEANISWIVLRPHSSTYLQEGPFKTEFIREGLKKGTFQFSQYAWHVGMAQWMRIGDLSEFDRRSTPRDSAPHIPPPLPDPISAVLLEDDGDFESEEFHVNLKPSKFDSTPTDPITLFSSEKESVAVGGAAAKIFDSNAFDPNAQDLARVPWEERIPAGGDHTGINVQAVELIDDESSYAGFPESDSYSEEEIHGGAQISEASLREDFTPQPFVPPPAMISQSNRQEDGWEKWGRYVAAVGMGAVTAVFSGHLLTYESSASSALARRSVKQDRISNIASASNVERSSAGTSTAVSIGEPASVAAISPAEGQQSGQVSVENSGQVAGLEMDDPMAGPEGGLPTAVTKVVPPAKAGVSNSLTAAAGNQVLVSTTQVGIAGSNVDASIVGLKLATPEAQILLQGAFPTGQPIEVSFRGRLGEVLAKLNVRKTISISKTGAEIPSIKLKEIGLPDGAYTVEVSSGAVRLKSDIFLGKRDSRFLDRLEAHLRESSFELQAQKKVLFYAAQELDSLARDLGLNYGQLRSKPEMWAKFYSKWKTKVSAVERSIGEVSKLDHENQAYPEETIHLSSLLANLKETSSLFEQGVGAQRDVASDSLTDLISELARQKEAIGSATSRGSPNSGKAPTSKAL